MGVKRYAVTIKRSEALTLKMEAKLSAEASANIHHSKQGNIPKESTRH
jgi:hypothetical protein